MTSVHTYIQSSYYIRMQKWEAIPFNPQDMLNEPTSNIKRNANKIVWMIVKLECLSAEGPPPACR